MEEGNHTSFTQWDVLGWSRGKDLRQSSRSSGSQSAWKLVLEDFQKSWVIEVLVSQFLPCRIRTYSITLVSELHYKVWGIYIQSHNWVHIFFLKHSPSRTAKLAILPCDWHCGNCFISKLDRKPTYQTQLFNISIGFLVLVRFEDRKYVMKSFLFWTTRRDQNLWLVFKGVIWHRNT